MSLSYEAFGKYILLEKLAVGGMAEIYLARNSGSAGVSKFVAIKRILPQFTEQTEFIDMFKDEAKIAVNLSHANVVSIYEFGMEKDAFFLAMDYIEGRNLRQILNKMKKSSQSFSIEQVLYIIKEVAAGLDHAHRCIDANTGKPLNIIHRDMSPQNVMVSFEGEVKIVDFGIAKAETQLETTRAGTLKGKFGYMSPEQAEGQPVDLRTDVFALGIVLWELLANDRLFVANNEVNTLRKIKDCQVPSLRKINPNIPPELERIVGKALAKDRNLRYQTSAAFHRDLSRFLNRQYPDFSPQDFSVFVKTLFAGEILESRKKMIEYAQIDINRDVGRGVASATLSDRTVVTSTDRETGDASSSNITFGNPDHEPAKASAATKAPTPPLTPPARPLGAATPPKAPRESWQQPPEQMKKMGDSNLRGNLAVDRTGFGQSREYSFTGKSFSRIQQPKSSALRSAVTLLLLGVLAGAGAFYFSNPTRAVDTVRPYLIQYGLLAHPELVTTNSSSESAPEPSKHAEMIDISISSTPSGAPIVIDGVPQGEVTPATIKLEKNRKVKLTVRLAGYLPSPPNGHDFFEEDFEVQNPRSIDVKFKSDKKGFLNVMVRGEGQIYINDKLVATTSPARMIAVPADEDVRVVAFDPKTKASDEQMASVAEGATKTIMLAPRVAMPAPASQGPAKAN